MMSVLVSNVKKEDTELVIAVSKSLLAFNGNESLEIIRWNVMEALDTAIAGSDKMDAAILDVTSKAGVEAAKKLRIEFPEMEILIVSDTTVSPIVYLNPQIRAASLLLKPLREDAVRRTLKSFFGVFEQSDEREKCLLVERKGEKLRLPYQKLIYLEARNKRVYARMNNVEYGIYDTIDHLAELLPETFVRCHRSYIVNYNHIVKVRYSENSILLSGEQEIPLSRSYKTAVKEVMNSGI